MGRLMVQNVTENFNKLVNKPLKQKTLQLNEITTYPSLPFQ